MLHPEDSVSSFSKMLEGLSRVIEEIVLDEQKIIKENHQLYSQIDNMTKSIIKKDKAIDDLWKLCREMEEDREALLYELTYAASE